MPPHFIFIPMMPQTHRELRGSESIRSNNYIYIVTLAFDWLKTVCTVHLPEKAALALFITGHR